MKIYYTTDASDPQIKMADINWGTLPGFEKIANEWGVVGLDPSADVYKYTLTAEDADAILNHEASWGGRGLVIYGQHAVLTAVAVE